ncbi:MAG: hypothetical protein WC538_22875 [Thermoanaerobaculia bacterium]
MKAESRRQKWGAAWLDGLRLEAEGRRQKAEIEMATIRDDEASLDGSLEDRRRSTSAFCLLRCDFKAMKVNRRRNTSAFCFLPSALETGGCDD